MTDDVNGGAPPPKTDHGAYSKQAALYLTKMSGKFVVALLLLTVVQLGVWYLGRGPTGTDAFPADCGNVDCAILRLEAMVQEARAIRALDFIASRHVIALVGMVIALAFLVLGAVLIFDRVESETPGHVEIPLSWRVLVTPVTDQDAAGDAPAVKADTGAQTVVASGPAATQPGKFSVHSTFPGMLMCGCGVISLMLTLCFAYASYRTTFIRDAPIFLPDYNFCRNILNRQSGIMSEVSDRKAEQAIRDDWQNIMRSYAHCFKTPAEAMQPPSPPSEPAIDRSKDNGPSAIFNRSK